MHTTAHDAADQQRWLDRYSSDYTNDADRAAGYADYVRNRAEVAAIFGGAR